jgi:uncharacterized protein with FMN-binding domain
MDDQTEGAKPARPWLGNNLVALGSVAVFSVYSAGYFRTREAAARFAGESVQRHAAAVAAPQTDVAPPAEPTEAPQKHTPELPVMRLSSKPMKPHVDARDSRARPASASAPDTAAAPAQAQAGTPVSAPVPAKLAAPAPASPPVVQATPDSVAPTIAKKEESAQLKDGVYYGWGTSRHGDIQASVEIRNGRIAGAYISQCLTQYSCSWVSALPGQVVQRQSAEVDYVSGATQSSNAFYYAVIDALKKAK